MIRPRRSLLFMPGSNARALEKAPNLPADGIILDLEDSVAPDAKAVARDQIAKAIAAGGFGKREVLIRVNSLDTPWWVDDVTMAGKARPDGILVPKISTVADLNAIAEVLPLPKVTPVPNAPAGLANAHPARLANAPTCLANTHPTGNPNGDTHDDPWHPGQHLDASACS